MRVRGASDLGIRCRRQASQRVVALLVLSLFGATAVQAQTAPRSVGQPSTGLPAELQDVAFEQRLGQQIPLDAVFRDESGREVRLGEYFHGKPVILALVYYDCPMLCTMVLNGLESSLRVLKFDAGKEFEIVAVSFDPRDTPAVAAGKKANHVKSYGRPGAERGWHFLTGDEASIRRLTDAVGFHYHWDPETRQFAHAGGIVILTPGGVLSRYFYGIEYAPKDVRLGLVEAADGKIGSVIDQVLLYCFHYDPATGKYGAAVMNIVRLGGVVTVAAILGFLLLSRWRGRRPRAVITKAA